MNVGNRLDDISNPDSPNYDDTMTMSRASAKEFRQQIDAMRLDLAPMFSFPLLKSPELVIENWMQKIERRGRFTVIEIKK